MAEGQSPNGSEYPDVVAKSPLDFANPVPTSSRTKRKLGRSGSKTWMNKSFDQSALSQSGTNLHNKPMRRQSSASDFFQSVLTKSRSHLLSLFSHMRKENNHQSNSSINERVSPSRDGSARQRLLGENAALQFAVPKTRMTKACSFNALSKSPPSSEKTPDKGGSTLPSNHPNSFKNNGQEREGSSIARMFIVTTIQNQQNQRVNVTPENEQDLENTSKMATQIFFHGEDINNTRYNISSSASEIPKVSTSVVEFTSLNGEKEEHGSEEDFIAPRQISSAPAARQRLSIEATYLKSGVDINSVTKRALVKSNSDTLARLSQGPSPIVKASSDGNCFKNDPAMKPLLSSSSSTTNNSSLSRITDYLFIGSVEAAYSEPLLCKYKISSLIDMTNLSPRLIPLSKKTDCPCTCVNKHHFRSKLNIGVDDIEWENLEQYFREINTFIEGTRKKKGRTLVFSYMGQSRAPAAVIQHLMQHYDMAYREALSIVESKRQQIKINPGFVKTLKRLELHLAMTREESDKKDKVKPCSPELSSPRNKSGGGDGERDSQGLSPPVVRGAWLEC